MSDKNNRTYLLPIAITAAFLAVAIFGIVTYANTSKIRKSEATVAQSYAIRESTQLLLSAMKDTETGQRGYLLTGEESFLTPYQTGVEKAEREFARLTELAANNGRLAENTAALRETFEIQQAHFRQTIEIRQSQPAARVSDEVLALVKSGRGREAMENARRIAAEIIAAENERLKESESLNQYLSTLSHTTITAGHLIALALIVFAGLAAWFDRRKRDAAESALVKEQKELAAVIESAFEGIVAYNDDFTIRFMNPAAAEIFGVERDKVEGRSILDFVLGKPTRSDGEDEFRKEPSLRFGLIGDEASHDFDNQPMIRSDGSEFPGSGTATRTVTDDERFTTVRFRDLTEFQTSLVKQREYTAILEQITDAVLVCELDGSVRSCNGSAEKLLGISEAEIVGMFARDLLGVESGRWEKENAELLENGRFSSQLAWVSPVGREHILEQRRSLIRDEDGQPAGKLLFLIDITNRVREEAKERRTQRLESIGTLAGGIAHDLNNVLTPIVMSAKLLKRGSKTPERLVDNIITSADRGGKMIKKLLAFAGGDEGQRTQVDLREILAELEEILSHTLQQTIDLQVNVPEKLRMIDADSTELSQVIMNLAINARDAMPSGGRIDIDVENFNVDQSRADRSDTLSAGPHVLLTIADNGEGIPKEIIDRIFDPFFTTKAQGKGTGLGLATTLGIIRSYDGDITVYSEPGVGTKFSIYLPSSKLSAEIAGMEVEEELPIGKSETVLIVDDESLILETARETLESYQYKTLTAKNGTDATAIYQHQGAQIDIVLLDMMMPGIDGFDTKNAIRSLNPSARIIASSGLRRPGDEGGRMQDFDGFLAKPYTDEQLLRLIRKVIDQPERNVPTDP